MIVNKNTITTLQVVASPMIVILTTLEVSFMLLANIYSGGVTHDDCHVMIVIYLMYRHLVFHKLFFLAGNGCAVVEHLTHEPNFKGSNPGTTDTAREKSK
jgi:hypothetical protein